MYVSFFHRNSSKFDIRNNKLYNLINLDIQNIYYNSKIHSFIHLFVYLFTYLKLHKFDTKKLQANNFPAGKYWSPGRPPLTSPGRPLKILFERPGDIPIWRPGDVPIWRPEDVLKWRPDDVLIWRSKDVPGRLIRDVPRTFSGLPLEDLQSTHIWISKKKNFSFRTYSESI